MKTRKLGKSDLNVTELGFGCMSLPSDIKEAAYIIDAALDYGINYFDTADLYDRGLNEQIIGTLLAKKRDAVHIATKVGNVWNADGDSWHWNASKKHILTSVKESLRRLNTDYIDLYQLHGGTLDDNFSEVVDAFETLKTEGIIREYGISSIRPNVLKTFLPSSRAASVMMQYSALDRRPEEWFDYVQQQGASIVTRGSIAKGLLTNEWAKRIGAVESYLTYSKEELNHILQTLASQQTNMISAAMAFNLRHDGIASLLVGASSKKQMEDNLAAYEQIATINSLAIWEEATKKDIYTAHRQ